MCICSNQYQRVLVLSYFSNQEISADVPISSRRSRSAPRGLAGATCLAAGVTRSSGTRAGEGPPRVQYGLARAEGWLPTRPMSGIDPGSPGEENTVPIKNKLCNRWVPVSCSSGTVQSYPSLAVAQGRLSHSWKSGPTDTLQQDRPVCLRGERFCYRPALGSVQTEKGWQRSLVCFSLLPSMKYHFGVLFLTWGQTAEHFLCCCREASSSPGMHPHPRAWQDRQPYPSRGEQEGTGNQSDAARQRKMPSPCCPLG